MGFTWNSVKQKELSWRPAKPLEPDVTQTAAEALKKAEAAFGK